MDINAYITQNKTKLLEFYNNDINYLIDDVSNNHPKVWAKIKKEFNKSTKPQKARYLYLTLSPDKFLRNLEPTTVNIDNLNVWCEKWFNQDKKFYKQFAWVIESGSKNDHLHIHAVMELKTTEHHARNLKRFWARYFPNNQLLTTLNLDKCYKCKNCQNNTCKKKEHRGEYCYYQFNQEDILADKLEYFDNEKKGTHSNLKDLGLRGSKGFLY